MKSKILFTQREYIGSHVQGGYRWVRATLVDHAPVPGSGRHAHVLTVSVDDGDMHTWYEKRILLPVQANALSIRQAIYEFDEIWIKTKTEMAAAGLLAVNPTAGEDDDDLAF